MLEKQDSRKERKRGTTAMKTIFNNFFFIFLRCYETTYKKEGF